MEKPAAKPAPAWVKSAPASKPAPARAEPKATPDEPGRASAEVVTEVARDFGAETAAAPDESGEAPRKAKYDRPARTGREPGMKTIFLNVGRKQLVTPADIVGKIAGVTRLPASVVGALDIHQRHTLADVAADQVEFIVQKLAGIMVKGVTLAPALAADVKEMPQD